MCKERDVVLGIGDLQQSMRRVRRVAEKNCTSQSHHQLHIYVESGDISDIIVR